MTFVFREFPSRSRFLPRMNLTDNYRSVQAGDRVVRSVPVLEVKKSNWPGLKIHTSNIRHKLTIASEFVKCWGLAPDIMTQSGAVGTRRVQDLLAYWTSHNGTSSSIRVQYHLRHLNQSCNSDQLHVEIKVKLMSLSEERRCKKSRIYPPLWPKSGTRNRFTLGPREDLFSLSHWMN